MYINRYWLIPQLCVRFMVHVVSPIAPGPVGNLQAFFNETGSVFDSMTRLHSLNIDIVWNEPLMPNGVITTYSVIVYRTDNSSDVIYSNSTLTAPNVTESVIVLPFANYTVNVAASTSAGEGDESTVTITSPQAGKFTSVASFELLKCLHAHNAFIIGFRKSVFACGRYMPPSSIPLA